MSWNILPKNVLQYFLTKLKGLMYTKTEVDNLIPSITPNPSTTTSVLNGLEIDGTAYEIQGTGEPNVQADWNEVDSTADDYIKNKPTNVSEFNNDAGYLTSHQDISGKVNKSGDTMSGTLHFSNYNDVAICLNSSGPNYKTTIAHENAGQEATVFATKFDATSLIFINGEDSLTNHTNNRWQSLVPGLQVKKNCVAIGKLIGQGVDPTYKLEVNGTTKSTTFVGNLQYAHNNEINFSGGTQATCYFNYRNADTDAASAVASIEYRFCNYSNNTSKSKIVAGSFNGYTIAKSVPSDAVFTDTNVTQTGTASVSTNNKWFRMLYSGTNDNTTRTEGARKGGVEFNPWRRAIAFVNTNSYLLNCETNKSLIMMVDGDYNHGACHRAVNGDDNQWGLMPYKDGWLGLGHGSYRWGQIYSTNSAISTSDRNDKKDISSLDDKAKDFIMALNPVSYKFIDGKTGRTHYGMIAQDVEEVMSSLGMTDMDFAGFCKDQKMEENYIENEDGTKTPNFKVIEGEYRYGLRYEEFIAPVIKTEQLQQEDINSLKEEVALLKEEIALLKQRLQILEE